MALVQAWSADSVGNTTGYGASGWTRVASGANCDITSSPCHPVVGYGGAEKAFRLKCDNFPSKWAYWMSPAFSALADGVIGFHAYRNNDQTEFFSLYSGSTQVVRLDVDVAGYVTVYVHDGSSLQSVMTTAAPWANGTTTYFGLRYKPGASGEVSLTMEGALSTATGSYHTGAWDKFKFYAKQNITMYFWMFSLWDDPADAAATTPMWVARIAPEVDDTVGGFTASTGTDLYAMVDETVYDAADYITSTTVAGDTVLFTGDTANSIDAAWAPAAIHGVSSTALVRGDGVLNQSQIAWESAAGAPVLGTTEYTSTAVRQVASTIATVPGTAVAFDVAAVNGLKFGIKAT